VQCFELAEEHGARTVSFPAIGTGVYGYPLHGAASIAVAEVARQLERAEGPVQDAIAPRI
jgi:O-acetyl-ADP-ribose deacetylase (regulator of RNase III)